MKNLRVCSNNVVEGVGVLALKFANAFAELSEGDRFEDFDDGFPDFFHDAADAALVFVGASAAFVEAFAHATDRREGSFNVANDFGESYLFGVTGEAVSASDAPAAFEDSAGAKFVQYLFEEFPGDILKARDRLNGNDRTVVVQSEDDECAQGILAANGKFHQWQATMPSGRVKIKIA
jgi:hypothetical protein